MGKVVCDMQSTSRQSRLVSDGVSVSVSVARTWDLVYGAERCSTPTGLVGRPSDFPPETNSLPERPDPPRPSRAGTAPAVSGFAFGRREPPPPSRRSSTSSSFFGPSTKSPVARSRPCRTTRFRSRFSSVSSHRKSCSGGFACWNSYIKASHFS